MGTGKNKRIDFQRKFDGEEPSLHQPTCILLDEAAHRRTQRGGAHPACRWQHGYEKTNRAACHLQSPPFYLDFIRENVREAFYSLHDRVSYANFNEFFNEKKYIHPELEAITELTIAKIRQVVFRIMEQTELIESTETGILRRPYLTEQMEQVIVKDHPRWLTIFLHSNNEINHLISIHS